MVLLSNSYIRDSTHIINILNKLKEPPIIITLMHPGFSCLYTNIPHEESITAIKEMMAILSNHQMIYLTVAILWNY